MISALSFLLAAASVAKPVSAVAAKPPVECNGSKDHSPCPAATPGPESVTLIDGQPAPPPSAPFAAGETLTYEVEWMGIDVGSATSIVETGTTFDGKPAIHLKASASSGRAFSFVKNAHGASESWIDPDGLFSLGFVTDQHDGSTVDTQTFGLDYAHALAHRNRVVTQKDGSLKTYDLDIPITRSRVQDAYSMTYLYRAFPLKIGQRLESDVFVDKKMWKLTVEVIGKETLKTAAGTFDCLKVRPSVSVDGVPDKKGEMTVWISDDARRIPVKTQAALPFGKVNVVLTKFTQGAATAKAE